MSTEKTVKVNLSQLTAKRRKKGRKAQVNPDLIEAVKTLAHEEAIEWSEANTTSSTYKAEEKTALASIMRDRKCDEDTARSVFENRWLSRYRQRAQATWKMAGLPDGEMDFIIDESGKVYIGRK